MFVCIADRIRKVVRDVVAQSSESPYVNIPFYQTRMDPSDTKQTVMPGPLSEYNDTDKSDRIKNVEDMRRQGPRPDPTDSLTRVVLPVTVTNIESPRTDEQGEEPNNTTPDGRNENRDTINFDPGTLNVNPFRN